LKKYQHLFFDLDRTLWDFESNSALALQEIYREQNLEARTTKPFDKFHKTYKSVNAFYWGQYMQGEISKETLRSVRFIKTLESLGVKDVQLGTTMGQHYIDKSPYQTTLFPNTIETLENLKEKGYKMHIITNGFKEVQYIKLDKSKLAPFFDIVIVSEEFGKNKPHPSIFKHAIERANTSFDKSLMIGDSLEADLRGAQNVNMDQVFFNPEKKIHTYKFTHEINKMNDLLDFL